MQRSRGELRAQDTASQLASPFAKLPVHGFVLVGGQSTRMGTDKALLRFHGTPMVEVAVRKLQQVCEFVSVVGNREDLAGFAPVVRESRIGCGPVAGLEAGIAASQREWALFVPVDVPLFPVDRVHEWAAAVLRQRAAQASFLVAGVNQPAFCMLHRAQQETVAQAVAAGERRISRLLMQLEGFWKYDLGADPELLEGFANVNTPEELAAAEAAAY